MVGQRNLGTSSSLATLVTVIAAFLLGGAYHATRANAAHYHTNCVGHGLVHGSSTTDGAVHARVEAGCGNPGWKRCRLRVQGYYDAYGNPVNFAWENVFPGYNVTCNAFSNLGAGKEPISYATLDFDGVFASHSHYAH